MNILALRACLLRSLIVIDRNTTANLNKDPEYDSNGFGRENPVDALIGSRIRKRRVLLGHSARLLSAALGVSEAQLEKWEVGSDRVGAKRLKEISELLQEPPSAFFEDFKDDRMSATANRAWIEWEEPSTLASSAENLELFGAFSRITDAEARKKVVAFAVALASDREPRN
jgi:transcriptional regulator with XRE-family HTH domain